MGYMKATTNQGDSMTTTDLPPLFTTAEADRRLTVLTKELRSRGLVPFASSFEIGERTIPQYEPTEQSWRNEENYDWENDDLLEQWPKKDYPRRVGLRHGEVVHIYVYSKNEWGDGHLDGTYCGWVGTPDAEPILEDRR